MCEIDSARARTAGITGLVDQLVVAAVNNRIYGSDHPRVTTSIRELLDRLEEHFETSDHHRLVLGVVEGYLVHDRHPLLGATLSAPKIIRPIESMGGGGVEIDRDTTRDDMVALLELIGGVRNDCSDHATANVLLDAKGCQRIRVLPPHGYERHERLARAEPGRTLDGPAAEREARFIANVPVELYQSVVDALQGTSVAVCNGETIDLDDARAQVERLLEQLDRDPTHLLELARCEQYDTITFGHSIRVAVLALNFARHLTDDAQLLNRLGVAALLHDVGKAKLPFDILHAQGQLTAEQRREMEMHATWGAEILLEARDPDPVVVAAAFGHHRTLTGQGYPKCVVSTALSAITKIVKICDVYEALTAVRPHKPAMSPLRAYRVMLSMQRHFEPGLLRRFISVQGIYPAGSHVKLTTGETAQVRAQTHDLERPVVRILSTPEGEALWADDESTVDLSEAAPSEPRVAAGPFRVTRS